MLWCICMGFNSVRLCLWMLVLRVFGIWVLFLFIVTINLTELHNYWIVFSTILSIYWNVLSTISLSTQNNTTKKTITSKLSISSIGDKVRIKCSLGKCKLIYEIIIEMMLRLENFSIGIKMVSRFCWFCITMIIILILLIRL